MFMCRCMQGLLLAFCHSDSGQRPASPFSGRWADPARPCVGTNTRSL